MVTSAESPISYENGTQATAGEIELRNHICNFPRSSCEKQSRENHRRLLFKKQPQLSVRADGPHQAFQTHHRHNQAGLPSAQLWRLRRILGINQFVNRERLCAHNALEDGSIPSNGDQVYLPLSE